MFRHSWILLVFAGLLEVINFFRVGHWHAFLTYAPVLLLSALAQYLSVFRPMRFSRWAPNLLDLIGLCTCLGAGHVVVLWLQQGVPVVNAPLQSALLFTGMVFYHSDIRLLWLRNFGFVAAAVLLQLLWGIPKSVLVSMTGQYVVGYFGGIFVAYFLHEQRKYRFVAVVLAQEAAQHANMRAELAEARESKEKMEHSLREARLAKRMVEEKVRAVLALADRINSPVTTLINVHTRIVTWLAETRSSGRLENVARLENYLSLLPPSLAALQSVSREVNEFRESNVDAEDVSLHQALSVVPVVDEDEAA